jgi:hypothetical protein
MVDYFKIVPELALMSWNNKLAGLFANAKLGFQLENMAKERCYWFRSRSSYVLNFLGLEQFGIEYPYNAEELLTDCFGFGYEYFTSAGCASFRESDWLQQIDVALMMGLLLKDTHRVSEICKWMDANRNPEYAGPIDYQIIFALALLANFFDGRTDLDIDALVAQVKLSKSKVLHELLAGCMALRSNDANGFQKSVIAGMKAHSKSIRGKIKREPSIPLGDIFATTYSILCSTAELRGMTIPELPPESAAFLLTRKSLHLE